MPTRTAPALTVRTVYGHLRGRVRLAANTSKGFTIGARATWDGPIETRTMRVDVPSDRALPRQREHLLATATTALRRAGYGVERQGDALVVTD